METTWIAFVDELTKIGSLAGYSKSLSRMSDLQLAKAHMGLALAATKHGANLPRHLLKINNLSEKEIERRGPSIGKAFKKAMGDPEEFSKALLARVSRVKLASLVGYAKSLAKLPLAHPMRKATSVMGKLNPSEQAQLKSIFQSASVPKKPVSGKNLMSAIQQAKKFPGQSVSV